MVKKIVGKTKSSSANLSLAMKESLGKISKGVDVCYLGNDSTPLVVPDVLSTGLVNLDRILCVSQDGKWGLPVGRIISVKARPSVGKTTFLLRIAEQALKRGGAVHIIESERALDIDYARKICPHVDHALFSQPDSLESAFDTVEAALEICLTARKQTGVTAPFVILMDSFSGFSPSAELKGDFSTSGKALGEHARVASMACRKLTGKIAKAKALFVLSHQVKSKIGVFWGSRETNIGGDAFNFHDSICINLSRVSVIKDSEDRIAGHYGFFRTTKNKLFPPDRSVKFKLVNGKGFNQGFALLDFLLDNKIVIKRGSWFHFSEDKTLKWQGIDNFIEFYSSNKKARLIVRKYL